MSKLSEFFPKTEQDWKEFEKANALLTISGLIFLLTGHMWLGFIDLTACIWIPVAFWLVINGIEFIFDICYRIRNPKWKVLGRIYYPGNPRFN